MKIMVAGGGAFGKEHLKTLAEIGGITLAVAEARVSEHDLLRQIFPLADCDADAFALLDHFEPDGVIVATPAAAHASLATKALERGIPVLVEKPVAPDDATMRSLCQAAAVSRAFLQPGHILRFSAGHRQLLDVLRSGEIGQLLSFSSRRYRDAGHAGRYADIDPVLMTMIHDIDLALWFDGGTAVSANATRRPSEMARSLTSARLESTSGSVWHLSTSWLHPGPDCPPDRVEIIGTKGSAEFEIGSHIEIFGSLQRRISVDASDNPLRAELDCFLRGIRAGRSHAPVTPQDAMNGLLAAEMIIGKLNQ
ncbi:Gfo/Idh/MocA family protein [Arvimicrobium flavum]|uniref:Gfo/Idh/MocA family protein n=1 Tax=Arvimicrobium flavum TaxID=3393320 RepID=UPI00237AA1B5|nr:Gfo/Idh/MocA family oxidoreductase [Mesorhizobium shangrilense]